MRHSLETIVGTHPAVPLAEQAAKSVLEGSFQITPGATVRIHTNLDHAEQGLSPLAPIIALGYAHAAESLGHDSVVLAAPTRTTLDVPGDEEIAFTTSAQKGDIYIIAVNQKIGAYSKGLGELMSTRFKREGVHYGQHFRLGQVQEVETYLHGLDTDYTGMRVLADKLAERLNDAHELKIRTAGGHELVSDGWLKPAKRYIGNFDGSELLGGNLPSGEVFTELEDLAGTWGRLAVQAYSDTSGTVVLDRPLVLHVAGGMLLPDHGDAHLAAELLKARQENEDAAWEEVFWEGRVPYREHGFGINSGIRGLLPNTTWIEKQPGYHGSIGASHAEFRGDNPIDTLADSLGVKPRGHFDVSARTEEILIQGETVFKDGRYVI